MAKNKPRSKEQKVADDKVTEISTRDRRESSPGGKPSPKPSAKTGGSTNRNNGLRSFRSIMDANINDISWYADHPELLMDACSIPFYNPLGNQVHFGRDASRPGTEVKSAFMTVPGITCFDVVPIPGWANKPSDPINVAADNIYSWVRHVNSGHTNYNQTDYMMYIIGVGFAYAWIGWMRRIYGQMMVASMQNRYTPRTMIVSEGVDFDDIQKNLTAFREFINLSQVKLGVLAYPSEIKLVNRWIHLFTNLFADSANAKAQVYKFKPGGYYVYDEFNGPGRLVWVDLTQSSRLMKFDDLIRHTERIIAPLVKSEDIGIMSGDTIKAFGLEKLFNMEALTPEDFVLPIPNPELLDQIQNMSVVGSPLRGDPDDDSVPFMISQEVVDLEKGAYITCMPMAANLAHAWAPNAWNTDKILNVENEEVLPPQVMILSRLAAGTTGEGTPSQSNMVYFDVVGSEIVVGGKIWYLDGEGESQSTIYLPQYVGVGYDAFAMYRWIMASFAKRAFDRRPMSTLFVEYGGESGFVQIADIDLDFSNYTTVSMDVLKRMHVAAVMSLLNVPTVGTWSHKLR